VYGRATEQRRTRARLWLDRGEVMAAHSRADAAGFIAALIAATYRIP